MDSGVAFAMGLALVFFGSVAWLIIHARNQDKVRRERQQIISSAQSDCADATDAPRRKAS